MNETLTGATAMVVHELRAPLAYVATAARLIREETTETETQLRCDVIERTVDRMLRMSRDVLEIAGIGRCEHADETYSPAAIVRSLVEDAAQAGQRVVLMRAEDEGGLACGDPCSLEALVQSLLNNAFDHGTPGTVVGVAIVHDAGRCVVSVENTCEPESRHRGRGLGHVICAELASRCGARLSYERDGQRYRAVVEVPAPGPADLERIPLAAGISG